MNQIASPVESARPAPITREDLPAGLWSTEIKIRFGQCDPAGIVYTPMFFDIFNWVIEDWYAQALGLDYYTLIGPRRIGLGYANAHADFFSPCRMGETLEVFPRLERIGTASVSLVLHAFKGRREALRGRYTVVTTDLAEHRSMPIPEDLRSALVDYGRRTGLAGPADRETVRAAH